MAVINLFYHLFQDTVCSNLSCSLLVSWWDSSSPMCYVMNTLLISCLERLLSIKTRYSRSYYNNKQENLLKYVGDHHSIIMKAT